VRLCEKRRRAVGDEVRDSCFKNLPLGGAKECGDGKSAIFNYGPAQVITLY
jgi:hypothetical protein